MPLATREQVQRALAGSARRVSPGTICLVVLLIGHGTLTGDADAKFNLVGPDMTASEWADLLKPLSARLVFVDTTSVSFPFMRKLAAPGRVVVDGDGFDRAGVRNGLRGVVRQGADRNGGRHRQERPRVDARGVHVCERSRPPLVRRAQPAPDRTSADRRRWRRRRARGAKPGRDGSLARGTYLQSAGEPVDAPRRARPCARRRSKRRSTRSRRGDRRWRPTRTKRSSNACCSNLHGSRPSCVQRPRAISEGQSIAGRVQRRAEIVPLTIPRADR